MIRSMTGFGAVQHAADGVRYSLEMRSVNGRYLKVSFKLPEFLQFAESELEKVIRGRICRGSVQFTLRVRGEEAAGFSPLQVEALQRYVDQIVQVRVPDSIHTTLDLGAVAALPGVCVTPEIAESERKRQVDLLVDLANQLVDALIEMRSIEGQALCADLLGCVELIRGELTTIRERSPNVVDEYRERLHQRVATLMEGGGFELTQDGLLREVALYAERCDISEELSRLSTHLDQFTELCNNQAQVGRKLDFLAQEMLREANTIGSKSNDSTIARSVIEIKTQIDRLKEQVQNVE